MLPPPSHDATSHDPIQLHVFYHGNPIQWVFDDPDAGLDKEPFVEGMPQIILHCLDRCPVHRAVASRYGFTLTFSDKRFVPAAKRTGPLETLEWLREGHDGGNWYRLVGSEGSAYNRQDDSALKGWLCPALFAYFPSPPKRIYFALTI